MQHRHLTHERFTAAAVDDIIRRGDWRDWVGLRRAILRDAAVAERIRRLCASVENDLEAEGAQRVGFWKMYVERLPAAVG